MTANACPRPAPAAPTAADEREASRLLAQAEALLRRWDTPLEATILAVVERRFTRDVATMAVSLRRDGVARLEVNPDFVADIGAEGTAFVLCHEALHLLLNHLRADEGADRAWTLAAEAVINHWVVEHIGRPLPVSARTGAWVGVDPRAIHAAYRQAVATPVGYDRFVRTDRDCAGYLRAVVHELPSVDCDHLSLTGGDEAGDGLDEVLATAVQRAADGDDRLKDQLLGLVDAVPDSSAWARAGVSELRATTSRLGTTGFWRAHLRGVVARRLRPRLAVAYDRKVGWWDAALLAELGVPADPDVGMPLAIRPDRSRRRHVAIYLDTSGSVSADVVDAAAATVGDIRDTDVDWHTFDHDVHPFVPGEPLHGGGVTSFEAIEDDLASEELFPDAVLVLTDGWAPPIDPPHPERWIWLIVADGDHWPTRHGMQTVHVPNLEGATR